MSCQNHYKLIGQKECLQLLQCGNYNKNPKISDTPKFAVITLNFEQDGFTKE